MTDLRPGLQERLGVQGLWKFILRAIVGSQAGIRLTGTAGHSASILLRLLLVFAAVGLCSSTAVLRSWGLFESMAGTITALKYQKRNRERVSVYLDGRFAFGLPAIVAAHLKPGQYLSDDEIGALAEQGTIESMYSLALNYLSYRPRSRAEVLTYLQQRGMAEDQIEAIVGRLERTGFVDDEAFARFWVENRERFRPRGLRALRYELQGKGLSREAIEEALSSVDVSASAYRAASKKAQQWSALDQLTFQRKVVEYLARRGFDYRVAQEAALRHWTELRDGE